MHKSLIQYIKEDWSEGNYKSVAIVAGLIITAPIWYILSANIITLRWAWHKVKQ